MAHARFKIALNPDELPVSQIVEQIERLVAFGVCQPGDELPGSGPLAEELGVSRVTVQKAYGILIERNILEGRMGSGTFIASGADARTRYLRRNIASIISLGKNLYLTKTEIVKAFESEVTRYYPEISDQERSLEKQRRSSKDG